MSILNSTVEISTKDAKEMVLKVFHQIKLEISDKVDEHEKKSLHISKNLTFPYVKFSSKKLRFVPMTLEEMDVYQRKRNSGSRFLSFKAIKVDYDFYVMDFINIIRDCELICDIDFKYSIGIL